MYGNWFLDIFSRRRKTVSIMSMTDDYCVELCNGTVTGRLVEWMTLGLNDHISLIERTH